MPDDIRFIEAGQIPKPETIPPFPEYDFVIEYHERALWGPSNKHPHGLDFSQVDYPHILMQDGIPNITARSAGETGNIFGPGRPYAITRFADWAILGTIDPLALYILQGKTQGTVDSMRISSTVGVIAPHSMLVITDAVRRFNQDKVMNAVFFLSPEGVYLCNGPTLLKISQPIADYWDINSAPYIEPDYAYLSYAWVDYQNGLILLSVPMNLTGSGTQTTCNVVLPYSYLADEWLDQWRYNSPPACGRSIIGTDDQRMVYYGDYDGYVWRANIGNSDNENAIEHYLKTSQISLLDMLNYEFRTLQLRARYKAQASGDIDIAIFPDDIATGLQASGVTNMSMVKAGYSLTSDKVILSDSIYNIGESIGFEFRSGTTSVEEMEIYGFTVDFMHEKPTGGP